METDMVGQSLDAACDEVERACGVLADTIKAATQLQKALRKAAAEGDVTKIRKFSRQLGSRATEFRDAAQGAATAWTWTEAAEEGYLRDRYEGDLVTAGKVAGVRFERLDDKLSAFPALVKILAPQRQLLIDSVRVTTLRPKVVIDRVAARQKSKPTLAPEKFLELLFNAYVCVVGESGIDTGTTMLEVYRLLTLHPEFRKQYDRTEFTRDIHVLDRSGVSTTHGHKVSFPAATGTKESRGTFSIIGPDGVQHTYYGIRFREIAR